jgi:hypothetical protein
MTGTAIATATKERDDWDRYCKVINRATLSHKLRAKGYEVWMSEDDFLCVKVSFPERYAHVELGITDLGYVYIEADTSACRREVLDLLTVVHEELVRLGVEEARP